MIYIKNAEIHTPLEVLNDAGILIGDGRIKEVFVVRHPQNIPGAEVIDVGGRVVCPGFIDVHLQGAGGRDFLDGTPQAMGRISGTLVSSGTTSYLATTVFKNGTNRHIGNIVDFMESDHRCPARGANCLGIHLEGPFINVNRKGMIRPDGIKAPRRRYLDKILRTSKGRLRMMTLAPELSVGRKNNAVEVIRLLRKKNIVASIGHTDASFTETRKGIESGARHVTHIFNAMRPMHHREPGPLGAILTDGRVSVQLISDGVHVHPEMIRLILKLKGVKNIVLITDSMSSLGLPDGRYIYDGWKYESKGGACRYKDGTLIGTSLPLNRMVERMICYCGISLSEALEMVTSNPARVLGIEDKKGSIARGKDADLVVMDKRLNIFMTFISGNIAYDNRRSGNPKKIHSPC